MRLLWIITELKLVQRTNAKLSIKTHFLGIKIDDNEMQPENAELPIDFTPSGIEKDCKLLQLLKTSFLITLTSLWNEIARVYKLLLCQQIPLVKWIFSNRFHISKNLYWT